MINEKLIEIIKEFKKQGKTDEYIKEVLLKHSIQLDKIAEHLEYYNKNNCSIKTTNSQEAKTITNNFPEESTSLKQDFSPSKKFNFKPVLIITGIIIIGLLVFFLFINQNQEQLPGTNSDINSSLNDNNQSTQPDNNQSTQPDNNQSTQPDNNQSTQDNLTLRQLQLFSSYNYPLNEITSFDFNFNSPDNNKKINLEGEIYFKEKSSFDITINTTFEVDFNQEELYSFYEGLAITSFFYPNFIVGAYNLSLTDPTDLEIFITGEEYTDIPEEQKLRYFVLKMLYPLFNILEEDPNNELSKLTSVILNKDYNFDVFSLSYIIDHNQEKLTVFEIILDNSLRESKIISYNLEREEKIETMTYNELFTDSNNDNLSEDMTILDCYSDDLSELTCSAEEALNFTTNFENRLANCEISNGTFALGFEPFFGIFRGYEILGEIDGNCNVEFWFLENDYIDSNLLNKNMVCEYDSSKRNTQNVNDCLEDCCSGELVEIVLNLFEEE
jgi:hypothetical protein